MLISFILTALLFKVLPVIVSAVILYNTIKKWFQSRNAIKMADRDNIAFSIKEKLTSGDYKVVQGIFNHRSDEIVDGQVIQGGRLDSELQRAHQDKDLVLYT